GGGVVQEAVVGHVDEELRGGRVRVAGAGHGHGVVGVFQTVLGFVRDRCVRVLLFHAGLKAAALHHAARDRAVEHGAVVVALVHVSQKILGRLGGLVGVEFEGDDTVTGDVQFDLGVAHGGFLGGVYFSSVAEVMVTGVLGTFWYGPLLVVATALILSTTSVPW